MVEIVSAGYGAGAVWKNVTDQVRQQYQEGQTSFHATNQKYGPDPFPNVKKILCVVYKENGGLPVTRSAEENEILRLPSYSWQPTGCSYCDGTTPLVQWNDLKTCNKCFCSYWELFKLRDEVWLSIANGNEVLCFRCAEAKLKRKINAADIAKTPWTFGGVARENHQPYFYGVCSAILGGMRVPNGPLPNGVTTDGLLDLEGRRFGTCIFNASTMEQIEEYRSLQHSCSH